MIISDKKISKVWFEDVIPLANKTASWQTPNFDSFEMYPDLTKTVHYKLNSFGYRDIEWTEDSINNSIWCLGHSDVFGIGVHLNETWCKKIENKLNVATLNLGINGASWDTISRVLCSMSKKYKPRAIIIMSTTDERREFVNDKSKTIVLPFLPEEKMPYKNFYDHIDDTNNQYNLEKNLQLITLICQSLKVPYKIFEVIDRWDLIKKYPAADKMHIGSAIHEMISEELIKWYNDSKL